MVINKVIIIFLLQK